ncbi:unnamed protein product [Amoebophrya sp. A120]|nr:unnamed protein product [Amoebophrya sp. A120]|eukprot:GSA120T00009746001.1
MLIQTPTGKPMKLKAYIRPLLEYVPEIQAPENKLPFYTRASYTIGSLLAFLVASQIPLYGLAAGGAGKNDPFYWLRAILASNRGTLMELGIAPIVTTSMILQFLAGSKIIELDQNNREDRIIYAAVQKLAGLAFTAIQAFMYVTSGMYGAPSALGAFNGGAIVFQLTVAGFIVLMLDEVLTKGWGIGSGISLFITTSICETIAWKAFSLASVQTPNGVMFEGAISSFIHQLIFTNHRLSAILEAFYRPYGANITNLIATAITFAVVVYFQGFRVDLAVKSQRVRGQTGNYPIRLFYTSNMPIILHSALISNVYFFSQLLARRFRNNFFVGLIGQWQEVEYLNESIPVGGLAYYLSPPGGLLDFCWNPFRSVMYCTLVITSCTVLSKLWIDISGEAPRDVARKLREQQLTIVGYRSESLTDVLKKYIPQCAALGGAMVAILTIFADLVGCLGSGTGMLLAVNFTYTYMEQLAREGGGLPNMGLFA